MGTLLPTLLPDNSHIHTYRQTHKHTPMITHSYLHFSQTTVKSIHIDRLTNTLPWSHSLTYTSPRQQSNPYIQTHSQTHSHDHTLLPTLLPANSQIHTYRHTPKH